MTQLISLLGFRGKQCSLAASGPTRAMPDEFPYDVFPSHHHADKPRVRRLAERRKAAGVQMEAGLRLWWDERVIQAGDIIALKVEVGRKQSRLLLLCLSPAALALGWVALERSTAVHRDPANAGPRFIPLLRGDCALPDTLRRSKVVDFRDDSDAAFAEVPASEENFGQMRRTLGRKFECVQLYKSYLENFRINTQDALNG